MVAVSLRPLVFESSTTEAIPGPKIGKPIERQYEFMVPGTLTLLAGVRNESAFSAITTEQNRYIAPIHKRIPIVLRESEAAQWLYSNYQVLADRSGSAQWEIQTKRHQIKH